MTRYITIRVTLSQAEALENAADLIAESYRADNNQREARRYQIASERVTAALNARNEAKS